MITNQYINCAIDYILNHINENISVDEIASHCNFSRYYFSRMFKMEMGESIYEFIKRMKMEQSAFRLKVEKNRSITDISLEYGYSSSNYSSSFKQHHKLSPSAFRRSIVKKSLANPIFRDANVALETFADCSRKISIEILADIPVIFERYKGNYGDLSEHWGAFQEKYSDYITEETLFIERTYDDPSITHVDECLYELCMTIPASGKFENTCIIRGGKFAVYHFKGPLKQIYTAYQNFFNVWFPKSMCEIDERYGFEIYRNIDCASMYMEMELCIPIK